MPVEFLDEIVHSQKHGDKRGIVSICSAHPQVLQVAIQRAVQAGGAVLVEATCNQVNQFGGYTGMKPGAFFEFVHGIAARYNLPSERLLLGGDHLGPSPWQGEPADVAMQKAAEMVQAYVQAGFVKIHLDTSMRLGDDDPALPLDLELAARRTARLARVAEETHNNLAKACPEGEARRIEPSRGLRYVIGTEVPIPGGAQEHENRVHVTRVEDARRTYEGTRATFLEKGLEAAWERVMAMVVQPGVEFGDDFVLDYQPDAAQDLMRFAEGIPPVYEAHSTDYQKRESLRALVRDGFAILKVGPALTFAFREAIFALAMMENELFPEEERSHLVERLDEAMRRDPQYWQKHYHGTPEQQDFARKYSLSDRIRYYWPAAQVQAVLERLMGNLGEKPLPLTLLNQFAPWQYDRIREGEMENSPQGIIRGRVGKVLEDYEYACGSR